MAQPDTNKILLITLSNIGDAVLTTPVLEALHNRHPLATIDIVTDARARELFARCPYAGKIILKDKQAGWRGTFALAQQLRRTHYDLVVDLRTDGLTLLLRAKQRLTRRRSQPLGPHAAERHFGVISRHTGTRKLPTATLWLSATEHHYAGTQLAGLPGEHWLALAPGARWPPKCWPGQNFHTLVNRLQTKFDAVILLGDASEQTVCQDIVNKLSLPGINLAGKTDLLQAAAVLTRSQLLVGNDSGPGHIAAAVGTPTVTLFGPGDPARYHPWHPQARWIQSSTGNIEDITVDAAAAEVLKILADTQSG